MSKAELKEVSRSFLQRYWPATKDNQSRAPCLLEPAGERRYLLTAGAILGSIIAQIGADPVDNHVIALYARHNADPVPRAFPDRHLHAGLDPDLILAAGHDKHRRY